jgi:MFS family permease
MRSVAERAWTVKRIIGMTLNTLDGRSSRSDTRRLFIARGLRAFGDGFVSVLLPVYLIELGFDSFAIGSITTAMLFGSAMIVLGVGMGAAHRVPKRTLLMAASVLMIASGIGFAVEADFWPLLVVAFVGTLNPSAGDVSVFLPLEQAVLADAVPSRRRTDVFASYNLIGSLVGALGALCSSVPEIASAMTGITLKHAVQAMFVVYACLGLATIPLYRGLSVAGDAEVATAATPQALGPSKRIVYTLAGLFSLDAFGGGFIVQSLLALWLFDRFGLSLAAAGSVFFWTGVLSAFSYPVAVRVARRFGLVNTMVFTHLPSNACLMLLPFAPSLGWALALLFVRSALSQMDVPTRTSYVMAVVTPAERAAAASVTSAPRSVAAAASPMLAGYLFGLSSFGWPLIIGGGLKALYDVLLLFMFRNLRPPEERGGVAEPVQDGSPREGRGADRSGGGRRNA